MKKVIILILILLLIPVTAHAKNYKIIVNDTGNADIISVADSKKDANKQDLKINAGLSNNKGYIKIKAGKQKAVKISTPKISSNQYLKLVNIMF